MINSKPLRQAVKVTHVELLSLTLNLNRNCDKNEFFTGNNFQREIIYSNEFNIESLHRVILNIEILKKI